MRFGRSRADDFRLEALVRAAAAPPGWHPSDASLAALIDAPRALASAERRRVVAHLAACAPCRDAVLAVAALD
jgi:MoxR-like ATPase